MYEVIEGNAKKHLEFLKGKVAFLFAIGNTRTAEIPGLTVAGENPELVKYTPPADVELLHYGECKSVTAIPATPDGKPTPALITYTSLKLRETPIFVVDGGLMVKPKVPYVDVGAPVGSNIAENRAMDYKDVEETFELARRFGKHISKSIDILMIGESIPAGTTTAAAVLRAQGLNMAVSSSMPKNPIALKRRVVKKALERVKSTDPLKIVSEVGDPVIVTVCGLALGSEKPVVLAGGTQMVAIANTIERIENIDAVIATTKYVTEDKNADMSLSPYPVISVDLGLDKSEKAGLRAFAQGFVKEGVGAGGAALLNYVNGITQEEFLKAVEENYFRIVESKMGN